nr:MAG TPA: hypothetical protein [Caudoviricetes sp.]
MAHRIWIVRNHYPPLRGVYLNYNRKNNESKS